MRTRENGAKHALGDC